MPMTRQALRYMAKIGLTMRTGEVAEVLNITPAEVRRLGMLSDGLQPVRDGRRTRSYDALAVERWLDAHPRYGNPKA